MNIFKEVKDAVSAREAASFYGLRINRNGMCCCPFHDDRHPSMKIDDRFHCFGCQADGDVIDLVQRMYGMSAVEAVRKLIDDFHLNIDMNRQESETDRANRIRLIKVREHEINIRRAYAEELRKFRIRLSGFFRTLHDWELKYAPTKEQWDTDHIDDRYVMAIHYKDRLEYILDILDFGENDEIYEEFRHREEITELYEREITKAEQRAVAGSRHGAPAGRELKRVP